MSTSPSKRSCENCGAPLVRTRVKGKYICQHCNTEHFDDSYEGEPWEEDIQEEPIPEVIHQDLSKKRRSDNHTQKRNNKWVWIIPVVFLFGCIGIILFGSLLNAFDSSSSSFGEKISAPPMLSSLPAAANAGSEIAYTGWSIFVDPEISIRNNQLLFSIKLKNWENAEQVFRYKAKGIVVYDDIGNTYPIYMGNCEPDTPYLDRQVSFEAFEEYEFKSNTSWCSRSYGIPTFSGVIPSNANHLYMYLEGFGVFDQLIFLFDL